MMKKVKLISLTQGKVAQGPNEIDLTPEELIVYTARVSNPGNQMNMETADRLIAFLVRNKHWSPFEMVDMTVEIKTSRAIAQQILRHRSFSFQEFSQRYAEATEMEPIQLRKSGATNRQSSLEPFDPDIYGIFDLENNTDHNMKASEVITNYIEAGQALYKKLLGEGVAKECARFILPLTTQSTLYMKGSVRSWIHYLQIRMDEHTQLEHREVALGVFEIFKKEFPNIAKGLDMAIAEETIKKL